MPTVADVKVFPECIVDATEFTFTLLLDRIETVHCQTEILLFEKFV
jgi:hypothetical protein